MASSSLDLFALPLPSFSVAAATAAAESSPSSGVTQEEFRLFHSIDRRLFTRLVLGLGRDPAEAMQVMALWLWLEDAAPDPFLVKKLLELPDDAVLAALADEAVLCLRCVDSDSFSFSAAAAAAEEIIPLTQILTCGGAAVSLRFFHDNRLGILRGVTRIVNEVCVRAFEDIILDAAAAAAEPAAQQEAAMAFPACGGPASTRQFMITGSVVGPAGDEIVGPGVGQLQLWGACDPYDLSAQRRVVSSELGELLLSRLNLGTSSEEEEWGKEQQRLVPPDDRTIFLTFSKGYPISESEVRDFFTKRYGEFVEAIHMQEVGREEQVLYARMVVRSPAAMEEVLDGKSRAKFTINGKHAWARKYVRKQSKTSPRSQQHQKQTSPTSTPAKEEDGKSGH